MAWLAAMMAMNGFDFGQLVWCWPEYVVTDGSCFNSYEVVGGSYVVVGFGLCNGWCNRLFLLDILSC